VWQFVQTLGEGTYGEGSLYYFPSLFKQNLNKTFSNVPINRLRL